MKKLLLILLVFLLLIAAAVAYFFYSDTKNPYVEPCDYSVPKEEIPTFKEVRFDFNNNFDGDRSLPLMAAATIDVDGDGVDEVFVGGGIDDNDGLFKFSNGGFSNISNKVNLPEAKGVTTLGAASFDMNNDGFVDLLVANEQGVFYYKNNDGKFEKQKVEVPLNEKSNAATFTIGDVNKDGHPDIFLCAYIKVDKMKGVTIFTDKNYGASSLLLLNEGDSTSLKVKDVTASMGLEYVHNTFQGVLVDVDADSWLDLVVAYDTGEARTYKNMNGRSYKMMPNPMTNKYGYPMGVAVGDYNNDGRVDFFFSNTGTSVPRMVAKGDLPNDEDLVLDWMLFRNDGNFKFTDVAKETKLAKYEFSWGPVLHDFNMDGLQDLAVTENYVSFPPHAAFPLPCRFLIQRPDGTFAAVEDQAKVINKNYGITPLVSDFNQDGYTDLIWANLKGPVKAYINEGGKNNCLGVRFKENTKNVGATVMVETATGRKLSDVYVVGEGLGSDQTSTLSFGLGKEKGVRKVVINYINGESETIESPEINKTITIE